jgi:aminoglycoside phosphotransferase (APT) family kinase protein
MGSVEETKGTFKQALSQWARDRGGESARVEDVHDLGGHSGETLGFVYIVSGKSEKLVIRLAQADGGERAVKELVHQASLLEILHRAGAKVAPVRDMSSDAGAFGSAYMIVDRLPGRPLVMGPDAGPSWMAAGSKQAAYEAAVEELARIHAIDVVASELDKWDNPRSPLEEIDLWLGALERAPEPDWTERGKRVAEALRANAPESWTLGMCHGDFQTNNVLFVDDADGPHVGGIVDWEIAHIGAVEHDLGWFLMMNDAEAWHPVEERGGVDLDAIVRRYEAAAGRTVEHLDWYRALACYRIAAIAGYKIYLHRSGRKIDDAWERASSSVPCLYARAEALLAKA